MLRCVSVCVRCTQRGLLGSCQGLPGLPARQELCLPCAAPYQMLHDWLEMQEASAGSLRCHVRECLAVLESTARVLAESEADILGLDAASQSMQDPSALAVLPSVLPLDS